MSANVNHVEDHTITPAASVTHATNSLAKAALVSHGAGGAQSDSKTTISSLDDLKHKAPKIYNAMIEGIAMNICNQMQHAQDRLKTIMRKASQGG